MIEIKIGLDSNGVVMNEDLLQLNHLFVSYITNKQIHELFYKTLDSANDKISNCLLICKQDNVVDSNKFYKANTYIYDSPTSGSIQKKNNIFNAVYNSFVKQKRTSKNNSTQLVIIDDFWKIAHSFSKHNVKQFKELLTQGSEFGIHFIIGSSMPFRNLLLQLMNLGNERSPINELGAELVYNPDELIFFREKNVLEFQIFYPLRTVVLHY